MAYHDNYNVFPPGGGRLGGGDGLGQNNDNGSWLVYILPYVEQDNLLKQIDSAPGPVGRRIRNAYLAGVLPAIIPLYRCPSDETLPKTPVSSYGASIGPTCCPGPCSAAQSPYRTYCNGNAQTPPWGYEATTAVPGSGSGNYGDTTDPNRVRGMFSRQGAKIHIGMVRDGTSNTILIGEILAGQNGDVYYSLGRNGSAGMNAGWAQTDSGIAINTTIVPINHFLTYLDPNQNRCLNWQINVDNWNISFGFRSRHPGGANFVFVDGSVHFLSQGIDHRIYNLLGHRDDGQVASLP
jgi:prepilin-type processing-associated H-X9-DG protein